MKAQGLVKAGEVRRVAIVGPGLDFADKDVGFDFYPQQTLQPFAVLDSLRRLGLVARVRRPRDRAPRHQPARDRSRHEGANARRQGLRATRFACRWPERREWLPEVRKYWEAFGDQIGAPAEGAVPKAISDQAELRAVRATPAAVQRLSVADLNIVTERLDMGGGEAGQAFDLVIATNVFIYYDVLEQALALANVEAMLKPGAFLLANFAAPQVRTLTIRPIDTQTTVYGRAPNGAENVLDFLVWYQARAKLSHATPLSCRLAFGGLALVVVVSVFVLRQAPTAAPQTAADGARRPPRGVRWTPSRGCSRRSTAAR